MNIPKTVQIGEFTYKIKLVNEHLAEYLNDKYGNKIALKNDYFQGMIVYSAKIIFISTINFIGESLDDDQIMDVLYHEISHGILQNMASDLASDELFVQFLGKHLNVLNKNLLNAYK